MTKTITLTPRGLCLKEAAAYCGVSYETYRQKVKEGVYPAATLPGGKVDRELLKQTLDRLSGIAVQSDPYQAWKRAREG